MAHDNIEKMLVLSTAHVTKETAEWLDKIDWLNEGPAGNTYGTYGWFTYAHDDNTCEPSAPHAPEGEYPADLWAVFQKARELGASYVLLDCDATEIDGLPEYDW